MDEIIAVDGEAKKKILAGASLLARCVALGEGGQNVVIRRADGTVLVTSEGSLIAGAVHSRNSFERIGIEMTRQCGSPSAILLAHAMFEGSMKLILEGGGDPILIKRGLEEAIDCLVRAIPREPSSVEVESNLPEEIVLEGGYASPYFVTNPELMRSELEKPLIFSTEKALNGREEVVQILERAKDQSLLIIAKDFDKEALAILTLNHLKNGLKLCAVKANTNLAKAGPIQAEFAHIDKEKTTLQFSSPPTSKEDPKLSGSHLLTLLPQKKAKDPALQILAAALLSLPNTLFTPKDLTSSQSAAILLPVAIQFGSH